MLDIVFFVWIWTGSYPPDSNEYEKIKTYLFDFFLLLFVQVLEEVEVCSATLPPDLEDFSGKSLEDLIFFDGVWSAVLHCRLDSSKNMLLKGFKFMGK